MSRAEAAPGDPGGLRAAVLDFYYHSIPLVVANLAWGAALLAVLLVAWAGQPLLALALAPLLAVTLAPIARLAATIARGEDAGFGGAWADSRRQLGVTIAVGAGMVVAATVLVSNLAAGLASGHPAGWALATLAAWGLAALWAVSFPLWILVADPGREAWPPRDRIRLAGLLLLAEPGRLARLAIVLAALLLVSAVLFAALVTISVSFAALVAARTVLPAADRLALRLPGRFPPTTVAAGRGG